MRFWDSSALVPLIVEEDSSSTCRALYRANPSIIVWILTRVEIMSSLRRKERSSELTATDLDRAIHRLDLLAKHWREIDSVDTVRDRAERLLAVHPLHAADSLQLGAALIATQDRPRGHFFVTRDIPLAHAARREGFSVDAIDE